MLNVSNLGSSHGEINLLVCLQLVNLICEIELILCSSASEYHLFVAKNMLSKHAF